jgi:IS30 family transposase
MGELLSSHHAQPHTEFPIVPTGSKNTHLATLVEHQSRFVMLLQVDGKDTTNVVDSLIRQVQRLPGGLMSSLTWDRGTELAHYKRFSVVTDVAVFFCDPRSPWQRGSNENTNGLLRQYFPKGSDLSVNTQDNLDAIALKLNTRPRKTLGYKTPAATLAQAVASTG